MLLEPFIRQMRDFCFASCIKHNDAHERRWEGCFPKHCKYPALSSRLCPTSSFPCFLPLFLVPPSFLLFPSFSFFPLLPPFLSSLPSSVCDDTAALRTAPPATGWYRSCHLRSQSSGTARHHSVLCWHEHGVGSEAKD